MADYARARFGAGTKAAKAWYSRVRTKLFGKRGYTKAKRTKRRGSRVVKTTKEPSKRTIYKSKDRHGAGEELVWRLLEEEVEPGSKSAYDSLLHYVSENAARMDYPASAPFQPGIELGSSSTRVFAPECFDAVVTTKQRCRPSSGKAAWVDHHSWIAADNAPFFLLY